MSSRCSCSRLSSLAKAGRPAVQAQAQAQARALSNVRPFSSTVGPQNKTKIPPESPHWIHYPKARQAEASEHKPARVKGTLPPPRAVFKGGEKDHKLREGYLEQTVPRASNEASRRTARPGSVLDVRRRMAESRRSNLEASLDGLWRRKQAQEARVKTTSQQRQARNLRLANAPDPADEILTRASVLGSVARGAAQEPDPGRFAAAEASRARTEESALLKAQDRRDAVTALYMSAAHFIVDEDHLSAEIDRLFSDTYFKKQSRAQSTDAANAWDVWGPPSSLSSMVSSSMRSDWSDADRAAKRQKSVAEDLTGGKMD